MGLYQTDRPRRRSVLRTGAGLDARHIYWLVNFALEPVLLSSLAAFVFCRFVNCTVLGAQLARQLLLLIWRASWRVLQRESAHSFMYHMRESELGMRINLR